MVELSIMGFQRKDSISICNTEPNPAPSLTWTLKLWRNGLDWCRGWGEHCCDSSSFKYHASISLYLKFGQRCLISTKQGTTWVRKISKTFTQPCHLLQHSASIIPAFLSHEFCLQEGTWAGLCPHTPLPPEETIPQIVGKTTFFPSLLPHDLVVWATPCQAINISDSFSQLRKTFHFWSFHLGHVLLFIIHIS